MSEVAAPDKDVSLRDQLEASFEQEDTTTSASEAAPPESSSTAPSEPTSASHDSQNADATTAAATAPEASGAASEADSITREDSAEPSFSDTAQNTVNEEPVQSTKTDNAPKSWRAGARELWEEVPQELRDEIYRREADIQRGIQKSASDAKVGRELTAAIRPYEANLKVANRTASQAVAGLFKTDHTLRHGSVAEKAATVVGLINHYEIDLDSINSVLQGTPVQSQEASEIDALKRRIAELETGGASKVTQDDIDNHIQEFRNSGTAEFYDDVVDDIAALLQSGRANTLQEAYGQAIWANPEVRKVLLAREDKARTNRAREEATKAAGASVSITGSPANGSTTLQVDPSDLRASLEASFQQVEGRI